MTFSRRTILLIAAALMAAMTAVVIRGQLANAPMQPAESRPVVPRILVAKRDLSAGSFVQAADLDFALVPANLPPRTSTNENGEAVADNYLYEGSIKTTDFNGAVVRRSLKLGDPVPQSALMKSGEGGFMSAVLEPGMRAVSIAVNATSGNAGFVSPGDRVDLLMTQRVKKSEGANSSDEVVISETFVHDVRVVAVDQMLDNPENKAILAKTVTVEVSPRQAEQIAVAGELGKISLALRSTAPMQRVEAPKLTVPEGFSESASATTANVMPNPVPLTDNERKMGELYGADKEVTTQAVRKAPLVPRVTIIRGDKSENIDFYQGRP